MQKLIITDHIYKTTRELPLIYGHSNVLLDGTHLEYRFNNQDDDADDCYENFETKITKQFEAICKQIENIIYKGTYKCKYKIALITQKFKQSLVMFAENSELKHDYTMFNAPFFECVITIGYVGHYPEFNMVCMYRYSDDKTQVTKFLVNCKSKAEHFENIKRHKPIQPQQQQGRGGTVTPYKYREKNEIVSESLSQNNTPVVTDREYSNVWTPEPESNCERKTFESGGGGDFAGGGASADYTDNSSDTFSSYSND